MVWAAALTVACAILPAAGAYAVGRPVEPGNATQEAFPPAAACTCHTMLVDEWSASMHSQALSDPVFNTKVAQADEATDGKLGPFCRTCHAPAAAMTGELAAGQVTGLGTQQGVGCMFCHQVIAMKDVEPGNTSHLVDPSGTRRAQIKDPQAPHPAMYSELHEKAEFCGGCHNVNHPVNGMHLESTFREWEKGPWADEGVVCQDCHMSEGPPKRGPSKGQAAMGAPTRDNIFHMTFVGANVGQGPAEQSTALLKSAAELKMDAPQIVPAGQSDTVSVTITNVGAGHYLPTGLTEVREMWLEVTAENPDGTSTRVGERRFGTVLKDEKGRFPVELWEAAAIESDDRIPPRESVTSTFTVTMPAGADKATLKAALYYRSLPDDLAKESGVENPVTEMVSSTQPVFSSEEAMAADATEQTEEPASQGLSTGLIAALVVAAGALAAVGIFAWMRSRKPS
jgi:hypothetical protein